MCRFSLSSVIVRIYWASKCILWPTKIATVPNPKRPHLIGYRLTCVDIVILHIQIPNLDNGVQRSTYHFMKIEQNRGQRVSKINELLYFHNVQSSLYLWKICNGFHQADPSPHKRHWNIAKRARSVPNWARLATKKDPAHFHHRRVQLSKWKLITSCIEALPSNDSVVTDKLQCIETCYYLII